MIDLVQNFSKNKTSYFLIHTRTRAYQGVRKMLRTYSMNDPENVLKVKKGFQ